MDLLFNTREGRHVSESLSDDLSESVELLDSDQAMYYGEPDVHGRLSAHDGQELPVRHIGEAQDLTYHVVFAALVAALGGIMFGYDVGIISAALLQLSDEFQLSCMERSLVVSTMLIGAVIGSLLGGFVVDRIGRRDSLIINAVIFIVGAFILAFTESIALLMFGRVVLGFAVALSAVAECIYISELSPTKRRGRLVSLNELAITIGFLLAYLVGYLFIDVVNGWRFMFALSAVPAFIQGLTLFFLPRSPRFLMLKAREKEACNVLCRLRGSSSVDAEVRSIKMAINLEKSHSVFDLFGEADNMRGRMVIGVGLIVFQQFTGQPNVLYFAPTVFQSVGFKTDSAATLATVGLGVIKVVSTFLALMFVDRVGRRQFLLVGISLMTLSIFTLGIATLALDTIDFSDGVCDQRNVTLNVSVALNATTTTQTATIPPISVTSMVAKWLAFICLMVYVLAYAFSFGPGTWLILSEIFPASIRGRAISLATVLNWVSSLLVSMTFLQLLRDIGVSAIFLIYAAVSCLSLVFTYCFVPETKNKSLEQISTDLTQGTLTQRLKMNLQRCCGGDTKVYLTLSSDEEYLYAGTRNGRTTTQTYTDNFL